MNLQSGRDGGGNAVGDGEGKEEAGGEQVVAKVDEEEEELVVVVVVEGNGGCCWLFFCSIITAGGTLKIEPFPIFYPKRAMTFTLELSLSKTIKKMCSLREGWLHQIG